MHHVNRTNSPAHSGCRAGLAAIAAVALVPWGLPGQAAAQPSATGGAQLVLTAPVAMYSWIQSVATRGGGPRRMLGRPSPKQAGGAETDGFAERQDIAVVGSPVELAGLVRMALVPGTRFSGKINAAGNGSALGPTTEFANALISEIGFPALDAASKEPGTMSLSLRPERMARALASPAAAPVRPLGIQKKWLPANFRLKIDGLDCTKVNKIEAVTIKQKVVEGPVGSGRAVDGAPAGWEGSTVTLQLPAAYASGFFQWRKAVIDGRNGPASQKNIEITLLDANGKEGLITLQGTGVDILSIGAPRMGLATVGSSVEVKLSVNRWGTAMPATIR